MYPPSIQHALEVHVLEVHVLEVHILEVHVLEVHIWLLIIHNSMLLNTLCKCFLIH